MNKLAAVCPLDDADDNFSSRA